MADDTIASVIALHQPKRTKTGAQRARAYRPRKRQKAKAAHSPDAESPSSESLIPVGFSSANSAFAESPVTLRAITPSHRPVASILLAAAAFALAGVGISTNGWVARSLGTERLRGRVVFGIGRTRRSRRAGHAVMCRWALAHPPARHLSCRMGCVADDLCLCSHRRHRLRRSEE